MRRTLTFTLCVLVAGTAVASSACSGDDAEADGAGDWSFEELTVSYPAGFSEGSLELVTAETASNCICGPVIARTLALREIGSASFRFSNNEAAGLDISVIDASEQVLRPGSLEEVVVALDYRLLASELGIPGQATTGEQSVITRTQAGGQIAARVEVGPVEKEGGEPVRQTHWMVFNAGEGRIYQFTCQYPPDDSEVVAACEEAVGSIRIAAPG